MPSFAVVFTDDHRPDLAAFAPVLADILGLSLIDARLRIRKGRGVFLERLDEAAAGRVAEALGAAGAPAEVVPLDRLVRMPGRPARLFQADCRPDALHYRRSITEAFRAVPWDAVRFVHAGLVATPRYRDFVQSKAFQLLPALHRIDDAEAREQLRRHLAEKAMRREADAPREEGGTLSPEALQDLARNQTDGYLDLFVDGRPGFLRADRREVVLDYLGARGAGNSLENFKLLVADAAASAARAHVSPMTRRLLEEADLHPLVFDDLAEFERYAGWVCLRRGIAPPEGGKIAAPADAPPPPEGTAVTACPQCGTVVEAGAARCPYCKVILGKRRRGLFWRVFLAAAALWMLLVGAGFLYHEIERRREAVDRVRFREVRLEGAAGPTTTIEAAIRAYVDQSGGRRRGIDWGVRRRSAARYEVEYVILLPGAAGQGREFEHIQFLVDFEESRITPRNSLAMRFLPAAGR